MNLEIYVDGTPLCETFNVIITDYVDTPPAPKTMQVTIPGADGVLDLSEWFANRPLFGKRTIEFTCYPNAALDWTEIEQSLTKLRNFLHGRAYDFKLSWDEGYTYHGRFEVDTQKMFMQGMALKVKVVCEPYKSKGIVEYLLNGELGKSYVVDGPAHDALAVITTQANAIVNINGTSFFLSPGVWSSDAARLHNSKNTITVNTTPDYGTALWRDYTGDKWNRFDGLTLSYLSRAGQNRLKSLKWQAYTGKTWESVRGTWQNNMYVGDNENHPGNDISLKFEWKDI